MKNLKGFVFTLDSIFALIVASAATSLLLLSLYTPATQIQGTQTESLSISQNFLQSTLGQAAAGGGFAAVAVAKWNSAQYPWYQYGNDSGQSSSAAGSGPAYPFVLFSFQTNSIINPSPVVGDGLLVFTTQGSSTANSQLYALNASSGSLVFNTVASAPLGNFIASPAVYYHHIYVLTSMGYLTAYSENGAFAWSVSVKPICNTGTCGPTGFLSGNSLQVEGGYLEVNTTLVNPANGAIVAAQSLPSGYDYDVPSAYYNGGFFGVSGWNCLSGNQWCLVFTRFVNYGNTITPFLGYATSALTQPVPTFPASSGGNIYFEFQPAGSSTGTLYATNFNGYAVWSAQLNAPGQLWSGPAVGSGGVFIYSGGYLYGYTSTGNQIFKTLAPPSSVFAYASTPSLTSTALYIAGGNVGPYSVLDRYNPQTGNALWNATFLDPGGEAQAFSGGWSIPIAYGNAYVAFGNTIYAVGTCEADPNSGILQALAALYTEGWGGCATEILNQSYNYSKVALFINNTYAPSLATASFTGNSFLFEPDVSLKVYNSPVSLSVWLYPPGNPATGKFIAGVTDHSMNNAFYFTQNPGSNTVTSWTNINGYGSKISSTFNVIPNSWNHLVITYNGFSSVTYLNGVQVASAAFSPTSQCMLGCYMAEGGMNLSAGGDPSSFAGYMQGYLQDVQLYNVTLSPTQVQSLYGEGTGGTPLQGIVAWLPLDGDVNDYTGTSSVLQSNSVVFTPQPSTPPGLRNSYQISKSTATLTLNVKGNYTNRNVSLVVWR